METVIALFFALVITMVVLAVVVPLTLVWLLVRQIRRSATVRRLRAARADVVALAPRASSGGAAPLLRTWRRLAADAQLARERFVRTIEQTPAGPLRSRLIDVVREVDAAVADAQRLAFEGSCTERAYYEVTAALKQQRRHSRSVTAAPAELSHELQASTSAQQASAQRLGETRTSTLCQLQLVVARLHELTAHALELSTGTRAVHDRLALVSLTDHVRALREATAEVEQLDARMAL